MIRILIAYAGAAIVFAGLDAVWLTLTNATLYRPVLAPLLADHPRPVPALLFYAIYLAGLVLFAVRPGLRAGRWLTAAGLGAAFGFVAYATYDLTNQATLKLWATQITVLDLSWGAFVSAVGATAGYLAARLAKVRAA
jgi:uncharacterized membrane protein